MSKQTDVLPFAVERLAAENAGCGIILHGSVQRGYERPDSDIDLFVITAHGDSMRFDLKQVIDGISVQVCYWPSGPLAAEMKKEPYLFYTLSHGRILSDPDGLAQAHQTRGRRYFHKHPQVTELWDKQVAEVRQVRISGSYMDGRFRKSPDSFPAHLWWEQFAEFLRAEVKRMNPDRQPPLQDKCRM